MKSKTAVTLGVLIALLTVSPAQAAEEQTHIFDETLSLTGGCDTSAFDPVPDPGPCPGVAGVDHPAEPFRLPKATAVDLHGNRYVASFGPEQAMPNQGRIDVFDSEGQFITQIVNSNGPSALAVDSVGNLYVSEKATSRLVRYGPVEYEPISGSISYGNTPELVADPVNSNTEMAIDPADDRLFYDAEREIWEFGSASEGNPLLTKFGEGDLDIDNHGLKNGVSGSVTIDSSRDLVYADRPLPDGKTTIQVFDLNPPHELIATIDGSSLPEKEFRAISDDEISLAVDEATGHLFVAEYNSVRRIYEIEPDGSYVSTISGGLQYIGWPQIAFDNGPTSPTRGYLFVPSGEGVPGRSVAYAPKPPLTPPVVESASVGAVTEREAMLRATINPEGEPTTYRFEYLTEQRFEEDDGFGAAQLAKEGTIPAGSGGVAVSAPVSGLDPGVAYRFRVLADSAGGHDEKSVLFATHRPIDQSRECPNAALRVGPSARLPDCRAYELVSPADTNGHPPFSKPLLGAGTFFASRAVSPVGGRVSFAVEGGSLPGLGGTGALSGNYYLAMRGDNGWGTEIAGPTGQDASNSYPGSFSPDQGYTFWSAGGEGPAVLGPGGTDYVRYPDGHSELLARGSLGNDPDALGQLISEDGGHILFTTDAQLEPDAPASGTAAIYDRTADGLTHVVSLLPSGDAPAAGEDAIYEGASLDGEGVAFRLGETLYLRTRNQVTYEIGTKLTFAGVAEGGRRLFYLEGGDLYMFDADTESRIRFTESAVVNGTGKGDVTMVNVAAGGGIAYFVSPSVLDDGASPTGETAEKGAYNLYLSEEGSIRFIARVTKTDVEGTGEGNPALGRWLRAVSEGIAGLVSSRATPEGHVLLFESRADLSDYESEGRIQVYRYDAVDATLTCLSCPPTLAQASGDGGRLTTVEGLHARYFPLGPYTMVGNLRADGARAFFESDQSLAVADRDGVSDVYEWEESGVGSCRTPGGCTYLISSGKSAYPNYLYGVSDSGDDVFFVTADVGLAGGDPDVTPSIYDARVNGGFPPHSGPAGECLGEACQSAAIVPPLPRTSVDGPGNVRDGKACPRGKRLLKRAGKKRCVRSVRKRGRGKRHRKASGKGRTNR